MIFFLLFFKFIFFVNFLVLGCPSSLGEATNLEECTSCFANSLWETNCKCIYRHSEHIYTGNSYCQLCDKSCFDCNLSGCTSCMTDYQNFISTNQTCEPWLQSKV